MDKWERIVSNSFCLFLLNFLFWFCNYYPRHILEFSSLESILAILINIIYYIIYSYFLVIVFTKNRVLFVPTKEEKLQSATKKYQVKKLFILFIVQLICDSAIISVENIIEGWSYIVISALFVFQWIIMYAFLVDKKTAVWKNRKILLLGIVSLIIISVISALFDLRCAHEYFEVSAKNYLDSPLFLVVKTNIDFKYQLKTLFLDSAIGIILIVLHTLVSSHCAKTAYSRKKNKALATLRIFIIISLFFVLVALKNTIAPNATFLMYETRNSSVMDGEYIDYKAKSFIGYRNDSNKNRIVTYRKDIYTLSEDGMPPIEISFPGSINVYDYYISENTIKKKNINVIDYSDEEINAHIFMFSFVGYYENGIPNGVKLADLDDYEYNYTVIKVCKKLLEEGSIYAFEYVCDYLYKYDREFIIPYIERYAMGDFTAIEIEWMELCRYRSDYVVNIARMFET